MGLEVALGARRVLAELALEVATLLVHRQHVGPAKHTSGVTRTYYFLGYLWATRR